MKNFIKVLALTAILIGCNTYKTSESNSSETDNQLGDTVKISSEKVEYEIIIIEPGFNNWLQSRAEPRGYYEQSFLESRNIIYVTEWNNRVLNPDRFDPQLYELQINYDANIDYGYEVNYMLYYYFIYFQRKYKQRLSGFVPRI